MKTGLLERFVKSGKNTLAENIVVCIAAALAGTFYFYEYYYESHIQIHSTLCLLITAAIAVIWLVCAAKSGKDGKLGFIIFAFLYWSIPYIYILYYSSRDNLHNYSKWLSIADRIAKALLYNPFFEAAKKLGTSTVVLAAVLLILVMAAYIGGFFAAHRFRTVSESTGDDSYEGEYVMDEEEEEDQDQR
ncbi:MAG: hypothetical protein IK990_06580 [Ruminiclostridium sp.]|nr:hypothetical protein [Ruminiclostridium sp.]